MAQLKVVVTGAKQRGEVDASVTELTLRGAAVSVSDDFFDGLNALTSLLIDGTALKALPPSICTLPSLQRLLLYRNSKLVELPAALGRLSALQRLEATENALETLPDSLAQLSALQFADLRSNELLYIPNIVCLRLSTLRKLKLKGNDRLVSPPAYVVDSAAQLGSWARQAETALAAAGEFDAVPSSLASLAAAKLGSTQQSAVPPAVSAADGALLCETPCDHTATAAELKASALDKKANDCTGPTARYRSRLLAACRDPADRFGLPDVHVPSLQRGRWTCHVDACVLSVVGGRQYQEDRYHVGHIAPRSAPTNALYFGVYDGHQGNKCSAYVRSFLGEEVAKQVKDFVDEKELHDGLRRAFLTTDQNFVGMCKSLEGRSAPGSTCTALVICENRLTVAHLGDTRAVFCRGGKAVTVTRDHKPELKDEKARILAAGGTVEPTKSGAYRLNDLLAVSRAFGDIELKKFGLIAEPEVTSYTLSARDEFVLLATDGLWDKIGDQQCISKTRAWLHLGCEEAVRRIVKLAIKRGSKDNVTACLILLRWQPDAVDADSLDPATVLASFATASAAPSAPVSTSSAAAAAAAASP